MLTIPHQVPGIQEPAGSAGSGITQPQHEALDTLVHNLSETNYQESVYSGSSLVSQTVYTTSAKTLKIRESTFTYAAGKLATSIVRQYNGAGSVVQTLTSTFTYSGGKLDNIDVVRT